MVTISLDIDPVAKGRPRFTRTGRAYTPAKTRDNENALKLLIKSQFKGEPIHGAVALSIVFNMARPKGVSATKRPWPVVRPDLDNLTKSVMDAANEVLWLDDSQVVCLSLEKRYASKGSIWLSVAEY